MHRTGTVCAAALLLVGLLGAAQGGEGDELWTTGDLGDSPLYAGCWAVAAGKGLVFVGGTKEFDETGSAFSVWAYRQRDGQLVWEDHFHREGGDPGDEYVNALAVKGKRLLAVGMTHTAAGRQALTTRAYDARNGDLLWEDVVDRDTRSRTELAYDVAIRGRTVFVAGTTSTEAGGQAFVVRALDLRNGDPLWEDEHEGEGQRSDLALSLAVSGRRVVACGRVSSLAMNEAAAVRAYDGRNGKLLWEDYVDAEGTGFDQHEDVAIARGRVFACGNLYTVAGNYAMHIRALRLKDGSPLWDDAFDRETDGFDRAHAVAVKGNRVVMCGQTRIGGRRAITVRAYGAKDGGLLWQTHRDHPLDAIGSDRTGGEALVLGGGRAYAVGTFGDAIDAQGIAVLALSLKDGSVVWDQRYDRSPGDLKDQGWAVVRSGRRLFVAGESEQSQTEFASAVLAYRAR